jgi:hypothetical protein
VVSGVREGSGLCVDGTPLRILHAYQEVSFSLLPDAVRVYKTDNENKGEQ